MKMPNIERFVKAGWDLHVDTREDRFHASVGLRPSYAHNFISPHSINDALAHLEDYLSDKGVAHLDDRIAQRTGAEHG